MPVMNPANFSSCPEKKANIRAKYATLLESKPSRTINFLCLGLLVFLSACTTRLEYIQSVASDNDFKRLVFKSERHQHLVYANNPRRDSTTLHVYLEGDGSPWLRKNIVSADPTPKNPLALFLMTQDESPSIYLGRPCYYGMPQSSNCSALLWTHERYSPEVVSSMANVLEQYLSNHPYENITFIGYSGGGALAMLLAERVARTQAVITIAANLDIDAWATSHNYSPLQGSLNPALRPPLVDSIKQIHFAGAKDDNVNPAVIASVARQQKVSTLVIYDDFDHICCWVENWREILYSHNIQ